MIVRILILIVATVDRLFESFDRTRRFIPVYGRSEIFAIFVFF